MKEKQIKKWEIAVRKSNSKKETVFTNMVYKDSQEDKRKFEAVENILKGKNNRRNWKEF